MRAALNKPYAQKILWIGIGVCSIFLFVLFFSRYTTAHYHISSLNRNPALDYIHTGHFYPIKQHVEDNARASLFCFSATPYDMDLSAENFIQQGSHFKSYWGSVVFWDQVLRIAIHSPAADALSDKIVHNPKALEDARHEILHGILYNEKQGYVLDVGAGLGLVSLRALAAPGQFTVIALDSHLESAKRIAQTMWFNKNLQQSWYFYYNVADFVSGHRFQHSRITKLKRERTGNVAGITIDHLMLNMHQMKKHDKIVLMRIHQPGFEAQAIEGAHQLISSGKVNHILLEWHNTNTECDTNKMIKWLTDAGYNVALKTMHYTWFRL